MVVPADVPPIAVVEDRHEGQEYIGLVCQHRVEVGMSSYCLHVEVVNAVAHSLGDSPAVEGTLDVKGLPFVPYRISSQRVALPG